MVNPSVGFLALTSPRNILKMLLKSTMEGLQSICYLPAAAAEQSDSTRFIDVSHAKRTQPSSVNTDSQAAKEQRHAVYGKIWLPQLMHCRLVYYVADTVTVFWALYE